MKLISAPILSVIIIIGVFIFCSACEVYHFEKPQPADVSNLYVFPKEFHGKWRDDKGETTVIIKGGSIRLQGFDSIKVINKFATRQDTVFRHYVKSLKLNKETHQFDTVVHFVIRGAKIYEVSDGTLESGFPFTLKKDTIYFKKETILDIELNQKAFLRKLNDDRYILNIHEESLWPLLKGHVGPWWQVVLLELTADHKINLHDMDEGVKKNASLIYATKSDFYFDVSWSKSELNKLADHGLFGKGIEKLHRIDQPVERKKK